MSWGEQIAQQRIQAIAASTVTKLDLSNLGLTEVPAEVRALTDVRRLDLSGNELADLPDWLPELDRLDELSLADNCLTHVPDWLGRLTGLRELGLNDNLLDELPRSLADLRSLETLNISGNDLSILPEWIGGFTALRHLLVLECGLNELPEWLRGLENLASLSLADNDLTDLPPWLSTLTALRRIDIQRNGFERLPDVLRELPLLTRLNVSGNLVADLPDWIGELSRLWDLQIASNQLAKVPSTLGTLSRLRILDLATNQLAKLPSSLAGLGRLAHLSVGDNQFQQPPPWIGELHSLVSLALPYSGLVELPQWIRGLRRLARLHLQHNKIPALPDWIGELKQLRELRLNGNALTTLPASMSELSRLEVLDVTSNDLTEIPAWIGDLPRLREISASYNKLGWITPELSKLPELDRLNLYGTQLREIPDWVGNLKVLTCLNVSENQLTHLPPSLAALDRLEFLSIYDNPLTQTPEWIADLPRLTGLQIGAKDVSDVPDRVFGLKRLRSLWIVDSGNGPLPDKFGELQRLTELQIVGRPITDLPDSISTLKRLTSLWVFDTNLKTLPSWIGQLRRLKRLDLTDNRLSALPTSLGGLSRLMHLDVSQNKLTELPENIGNLTRLVSLRAKRNQLTALPASVEKLGRLVVLSVPVNSLERLPNPIRGLRNLARLEIYDNGVSVLPNWIGELGSLTRLDLDRNDLAELPPTISGLGRLRELNISFNRFEEVPEALRDLDRLYKLWLNDNKLRFLPNWLVDLPRLDQLTLQNNPLVSPPPEIVSSGPTSTLEFLRARKLGSIRQWISKMLVVGEGAVGKTSTIKRLRGESFDRREETTHGVRVYDYSVRHPTAPKITMELNTWDFGGQEIYHATHQFFLTDRSLFLLLWNSRMQWIQGRLRYWLDIIAARAPESPILLVATNAPAGGRPVDLPLDDLKREYPQIVTNIEIDNETGHGLDNLRAAIAEQAARLPLMGIEWPHTWLLAADAIRDLPEKHVTPARLWKEMADTGLRDEKHQRYVARALHQLGDILYYEDDPELADTVILRPEWVNEYISRVLDSPEVERAKGLLRRDHLRALWADLDRGMQEHFLGMMDKYDLSYRVDGGSGGDLSLVVERLPWNAPPYQEKWDRAAAGGQEHEIRVIYQLNTTPPGIPTWFIARSHRFSTEIHWRTGALLRHPDGQHRALIRTDIHRNAVELTVRGSSPAKFFAVLDDGLNFTLARYPGLSVKRMVPCPCAAGASEPCDELYDFDDLERRLARNPPRHSIECRKSGADVHVPLLLLGLAPSDRDEWRTRLEQLEQTAVSRHAEIVSRLDDLSGDLQRQFLKVQQQVQAGLETACPSVFVVTPVRSSKVRGATYELSLYCEEPGGWHPLPEGTGTYSISESPLWLRRFAPYLRELVNVLKHAAPLVGPLLGVSVDKLNEHVKADVDAMKVLIDQIPSVSASAALDEKLLAGASGLGGSVPEERATTEADFRALQTLFEQIDPERRWGGLSRVATPEGLTVYLCPEHAAPYRRLPRAA